MVNARAKGGAGERELCGILQSELRLEKKPERNLEQVRNGGTDIILPPFGIEVKRRQTLDLQSWWIQVKTDCEKYKERNLTPVVAFRQNGQPWEFLVSAQLIGNEKGFIRLTRKTFFEWARPTYWKEYNSNWIDTPDFLRRGND